jgi:hypothetical protein
MDVFLNQRVFFKFRGHTSAQNACRPQPVNPAVGGRRGQCGDGENDSRKGSNGHYRVPVTAARSRLSAPRAAVAWDPTGDTREKRLQNGDRWHLLHHRLQAPPLVVHASCGGICDATRVIQKALRWPWNLLTAYRSAPAPHRCRTPSGVTSKLHGNGWETSRQTVRRSRQTLVSLMGLRFTSSRGRLLSPHVQRFEASRPERQKLTARD